MGQPGWGYPNDWLESKPILLKIKNALDNVPMGARKISENEFPIIFAEEAFVPWDEGDAFIMHLLIGGSYIVVHRGGYERSATEKGSPGPVYVPRSYDDTTRIVDGIRRLGALVELTEKGRSAHVWSSDDGFCVNGRWDLNTVKNWTEPAPDSNGRILTHISAELKFKPIRLGQASPVDNPFGAGFYRSIEPTAIKYNDGWKMSGIKLE